MFGRALLASFLDVLAPRCCVACARAAPLTAGYCADCGVPAPLLDVTGHIEGVPVFAGVRYAEPVVSAIHRFKYGSAPESSRALASLSMRAIDLLGLEPGQVWVPVPLHPLRLAERGYNQAALLARELSRMAQGTVDAGRLRRVRHTAQQAKRDRQGRGQNVAGAFVARKHAAGARDHVGLVDDVVTTGATLAACIQALRAVGHGVVGCVAVASAAAPGTELTSGV
jgi:ComF family protein